MRGCWRRALALGAALALVLCLTLGLTRPGRVAVRAAGLLLEVFPNSPAYPLRWFTEEPVRTKVRYPVGASSVFADIYRPAGNGRHGAVVFYIGVGPATRNNPHVVRLSRGLARAGVVVMLPVSENLSNRRVVPEEKEAVIAAYRRLVAEPYVDARRVGLAGVSVGGSMVALAAQDPRIAEEVRLVQLVGSPYDAADVLAAVASRQVWADGEWRPWEPSPIRVEDFQNLLPRDLPPSERPLMAALYRGETVSLPPDLSPSGAAVARLLANRDPRRSRDLVAALPKETRAYLAAISPSTHVDRLRAELFLLHDAGDAVIPFTESRRFYEEARNVRGKRLTEVELLGHVEPGNAADPWTLARDGLALYRHLYALLSRLS
jgi:acetyl esterase/lipase